MENNQTYKDLLELRNGMSVQQMIEGGDFIFNGYSYYFMPGVMYTNPDGTVYARTGPVICALSGPVIDRKEAMGSLVKGFDDSAYMKGLMSF